MSLIADIRYGFIQRHGAIGQIIVINVALFLVMALIYVTAFLFKQSNTVEAVFAYLYLPYDLSVLMWRPWTPITYMFVHDMGQVFHILFNMLWLYWIGIIYRQFVGDRVVWATFVMGALVGGLVFVTAYNVFPVFEGLFGPNVPTHLVGLKGASAGVTAVVVATATLVPNYSIFLMFLGPVKLKWVALFMVIIDFVFLTGSNAGGMFSHLGGALFGLLYITFRRRGYDLAWPFTWFATQLGKVGAKPRRRQPKLTVIHTRAEAAAGRTAASGTTSGAASAPGKPTQQEIDRILDKIAAVGYDKLTKEEKQALYNASKE